MWDLVGGQIPSLSAMEGSPTRNVASFIGGGSSSLQESTSICRLFPCPSPASSSSRSTIPTAPTSSACTLSPFGWDSFVPSLSSYFSSPPLPPPATPTSPHLILSPSSAYGVRCITCNNLLQSECWECSSLSSTPDSSLSSCPLTSSSPLRCPHCNRDPVRRKGFSCSSDAPDELEGGGTGTGTTTTTSKPLTSSSSKPEAGKKGGFKWRSRRQQHKSGHQPVTPSGSLSTGNGADPCCSHWATMISTLLSPHYPTSRLRCCIFSSSLFSSPITSSSSSFSSSSLIASSSSSCFTMSSSFSFSRLPILLFMMLLLVFNCSSVSSSSLSPAATSASSFSPSLSSSSSLSPSTSSSSGSMSYPPKHKGSGHHHHGHKIHDEPPFTVVMESGTDRDFDIQEEIRDSISSLNQLRMLQEQATPKNVTAQVGHPVYLHCIVEPVGDKMVSWLRLRDFHLLTVGLFTYTSDDRFIIRHGTLQPNDWALQIKHVTPSDEGIYECQVNTDPPRSQYYRLSVVVPETKMVGSPDMFVRAGSPLNLTCIMLHSPEPPSLVFWYHNDRMINYDFQNTERGSISLAKDVVAPDSVVSRLVIKNTRLNDSGNYSCHFVGSSAEPSHIYVHVLQGEKSKDVRPGLTNLVDRLGDKRQSDHVQNDDNDSERSWASYTYSSWVLLSIGLIATVTTSIMSIL